ncbi:MAG: hypothetical protein ACXWUE_28650 [Polyangiales bacterium]
MKSEVSGTRAKNAPYDALRRARHRELQHKDEQGLRGLLDDYFALADELEPGPPSRAA